MTSVRIIIDLEITGDDVSVSVTCRPMLPVLSIADLLQKTADEVTCGRLDSLKIQPLSE